jgi:hypothetical protein
MKATHTPTHPIRKYLSARWIGLDTKDRIEEDSIIYQTRGCCCCCRLKKRGAARCNAGRLLSGVYVSATAIGLFIRSSPDDQRGEITAVEFFWGKKGRNHREPFFFHWWLHTTDEMNGEEKKQLVESSSILRGGLLYSTTMVKSANKQFEEGPLNNKCPGS